MVIEDNDSDKWREIHMRCAFRNVYDPIAFRVDSTSQNRVEVDLEFQTAWMKMRLYEYYQSHKDSVDKYGKVLPEMKMSEEVIDLNTYLGIKGQED